MQDGLGRQNASEKANYKPVLLWNSMKSLKMVF